MKTILFLLLSWVLSQTNAAAQTRAAGPWRIVSQAVRYKPYHDDWGGVEDWGDNPSPTTKHDTATAVRVQHKLYRVPWNVHPDSVTLFLDCQNPLLAPTASRGRLAPIRFVATGATVRLDSKQHLLLLLPSAPVVVLWAYQKQQLVFRHEFKAVPPPQPIVKCYVGGCMEANDALPGEQRIRRTFTLRALPDQNFAEVMPEDARYRVARFRATLLRQGQAAELVPRQPAERIVQGPQGDMSDLISSSQPGDQLQLDVLLVQRQNSLGIITEVPVTQRFRVHSLKCPAQE